MKYLLILLFALLLLASCKQLMQGNSNTNDINPPTSTVKDTAVVSCSDLAQSLVAGPFKEGTSPKELMDDKDNHFVTNYEIDRNPDNNNAKDTDIVVSGGNTEFRFLKTGKQTMVYKAVVYKNTAVLESNCRIGMKRSDFMKQNKLQAADTCNAIMLLSHNETLTVTVLFKADTINSITAQTLGD